VRSVGARNGCGSDTPGTQDLSHRDDLLPREVLGCARSHTPGCDDGLLYLCYTVTVALRACRPKRVVPPCPCADRRALVAKAAAIWISTIKSASSAPLLIAVQGIEWLLARNLRLPSHGLARPQHTGCGSRHSFNFHNTTIPPRSTPGPRHCGSAGGGGSRWRVAVRRFTLSGIGHTWARASTSTSTSAPRARALNGERKLYAAWERGRVDGSENHCALRNITP
jgi:hypothetical protein